MKTFALALLEDGSVTTDTILTQLLRLQQVCSGHVKMDDGEMKTFNSAKLPELMSVLEEVDGKVIKLKSEEQAVTFILFILDRPVILVPAMRPVMSDGIYILII